MKYVFALIFALFFIFTIVSPSLAVSTYVLPYPGIMPGNKLYQLNLIKDTLQGYLVFGDFAQFKYNLHQSDNYLVEAKTLFEYNQYPLAMRALVKSNEYFLKLSLNLSSAKKNGKNIKEKEKIFKDARLKHTEILEKLLLIAPESFIWQDERMPSVNLNIKRKIGNAIKIRK
jgi:hypothetical protein